VKEFCELLQQTSMGSLYIRQWVAHEKLGVLNYGGLVIKFYSQEIVYMNVTVHANGKDTLITGHGVSFQTGPSGLTAWVGPAQLS
jgi:hypothetical protein